MPRISQDQQATIRLIQDNLRDRYFSGFPVFKELLANADDAHASQLELVWTPGIKHTDHPLLCSPALVAVNDGPFRKADEQGLQTLGLGAREEDESAIGRFGLGLKSVFHFCDAFFYLASSFADDKKQGRVGNVLSPWFDRFHGTWDVFHEEDRKRMLRQLESLVGRPPWFIQWFPLRRADHPGPRLSEEFPGDAEVTRNELFAPDLGLRLGLALPLLKDVHRIGIWRCDGKRPVQTADVALAPGSRRRSYYPGRNETPSANELAGVVRVSTWNSEHQEELEIGFDGREILLDDPTATRLKEDPHWPKRLAREGSENGDWQKPEKGAPHGAVVILNYATRGESRLREQWAVFLPVGEPDGDVRLRCDRCFEIYFHGYFFVDSGRRSINFASPTDGPPKNEHELRNAWNRVLRDRATLTQLIPALERMVERNGFRESAHTRELTLALSKHLLLQDQGVKSAIGTEWHWIYSAVGERGWRARPSRLPVVTIPAPPENRRNDHLRAFPALDQDVHGAAITFRNWPMLGDCTLATWPASLLETVLRSTKATAYQDPDLLSYVLEFLKHDCLPDPVQEGLLDAWRESLGGVVQGSISLGLKDRSASLRTVIGGFPSEYRVKVRLPVGEDGLDLLVELRRVCRRLLFLPSEVEPEGTASAGRPTQEELAAMLRAAALLCERKPRSGFDRFLADFIAAFDGDVEAVASSIEKLPLFPATTTSGQELLSLSQLRDLADQGMLFAGSQKLLRELGDAVAGPPPATVLADLGREIVRLLRVSGEPRLSACDAEACTQVLTGGPRLGPAKSRRRLLRALLEDRLPYTDGKERRRAVRYLLHGNLDALPDDDAALLAEDPAGEKTPWGKLSVQAMAETSSAWRVLDPVLVACLRVEDMESMGVGRLGPALVLSLLQEVGPQRVDCSSLLPEERSMVLRDLPSDEVLRHMRIYETVRGDLVSLGSLTFPDGIWARRLCEAGLPLIRLRMPSDRQAAARLDELTGVLRADAALGLMLDTVRPVEYWELMLRAADEYLQSASPATQNAELLGRVRSEPWLPTAYGTHVSPNQIVRLPNAPPAVNSIVLRCGFVPYDGLSQHVVKHHYARVLRQRILRDEHTMTADLLRGMSERSDYRLGTIRLEDPDAIRSWSQIFGNEKGHVAMPGAPFVSYLAGTTAREQLAADAARRLAGDLSDDRLVSVLNFLAERHERSDDGGRGSIEKTFGAYLKQARDSVPIGQLLRRVRLLSQAGEWTPPVGLCRPAPGIESRFLLDHEQDRILGLRLGHAVDPSAADAEPVGFQRIQPQEVAEASRLAAAALRKYVAPWSGHIRDELVGGILALLGGDEGVQDLARHYLGNVDLSVFRKRLYIDGLIAHVRFVVEFVRGSTVTVISLVGQPLIVRLCSEFESLIVGRTVNIPCPGQPLSYELVRLRAVSIQQMEGRLAALVRETARILHRWTYVRSGEEFDTVWEQLAETEQLDIEVARVRSLEAAPFYLKQLGLASSPVFGLPLRHLDDADRRRVQEVIGGVADEQQVGAKDVARAREELRRLLENDLEAQAEVLGAIRRKIGEHAQYRPSSVLFELFQNADDAVGELEQALQGSEGPPRATDRVALEVDAAKRRLIFRHRGREINRFRIGDLDGRSLGYDADLEKMLVLQATDKQGSSASAPTTGKFGLGFKSVFLVSDSPLVRSGGLAFRIAAGVLPLPLGADTEDLRRCSDTPRDTVIALPLREDVEPHDVLGRFLELCPFLTVFARNIRRIQIADGQRTAELEWEPRSIPGASCFHAGQLKPFPDAGRATLDVIILQSRLADRVEGALALAHRNGQIVPFPDSVPTVWCTTPTEENLKAGIVIHGAFDVDVGRARVATGSQQTARAAENIARGLRMAFFELYEHWQEALGVNSTGPYSFWSSVWEVLTRCMNGSGVDPSQRSGVADTVRQAVLGDRNTGYWSLAQARRVVPTRLNEPHKLLTRIGDIQWSVMGALSRNAEIFRAAIRLPSCRKNAPPGSVASDGITKVLKAAFPDRQATRLLSIGRILRWELPNSEVVTPEVAHRLFPFVGTLKLRRGESDLDREEQREVLHVLETTRFRSMAGSAVAATRLLVPDGSDPDEALRASFAPPERVLAGEYSEDALSLFLECRDRFDAPASELAEWARAASELKRQQRVLEYVLNGSLGAQLSRELTHGLGGWIEELTERSPLLDRFSATDRAVILGRLAKVGEDDRLELAVKQLSGGDPSKTESIRNHLAGLLEKHGAERLEALLQSEEKRERRSESLQIARERGLQVQDLVVEILRELGKRVDVIDRGYDLAVYEERSADPETDLKLLEIGPYLVEVKSTRQREARLTPLQAATAVKNQDRYVLWVVDLRGATSDWPEIAEVASRTKIVCDIGTRLKPVVTRIDEAGVVASGIRVDHDDQMRYCIEDSVWEEGIGLKDWLVVAFPLQSE